jgi:hypothetical protein
MAGPLICARESCTNVVPPKPPGSPGVRPRFCSQKCQKQAWENVPVPCPRCGGEKFRRSAQCLKCETEVKIAGRVARDDDIVLMWNEGMSQREIAVTLGYSPNSRPPELSRLMSEGRIQARREGYRRRHAQRDQAA